MLIMIKQIIAPVGLALSLFANTGLAGNLTFSWAGLIERPESQFNDSHPFNFGGDGGVCLAYGFPG
jgi:hypothetical protein